MKILLLGSGAREHALARALARDPQTSELIVAPGNPGTSAIATNLNIDPSVPEEVVALATQMKADLVVVSPRQPWTVDRKCIQSKCKWSPMMGHTYRWRVLHTFCNGHHLLDDGRFDSAVRGEMITFRNGK